jgi:hypothetical protein
MNAWTPVFIYLTGALLVALRMGWHIHFRLDKYDWEYCDVGEAFWFAVILWPLFLLKPILLIHPQFSEPWWREGSAEAERAMDRLEAELPPCTEFIRFSPEHDQWGECSGEFVFAAGEVAAIMEKRLAELSAEEQGRYSGILKWLSQRDSSRSDMVDVPAPWHYWFLNVAIGMVNRQLGQVRCRQCDKPVPHEDVYLDWQPKGRRGSGWSFNVWSCPKGHKLLTKDFIHIYAPSVPAAYDTVSEN